jgi:hypothetical protein
MPNMIDDYDLVEQLVAETLESWDSLSRGKIDWSNKKWAVDTWARIFKEKVATQVRDMLGGLVLANRRSCMGRFALTFNAYLYYAIVTRDTQLFESIIASVANKKASLPEVYDNEYLQKCQLSKIDEVYDREIRALWKTYEIHGKTQRPSGSIVNSKVHAECFHDVCTSPSTSPIDFINNPAEVQKIYVSEKRGEMIYVWSFCLYDLVARVVQTNPINPYTGEQFEEQTLSNVSGRFQVEVSMFSRGQREVATKVPSYLPFLKPV